jgi:hypothetical protein
MTPPAEVALATAITVAVEMQAGHMDRLLQLARFKDERAHLESTLPGGFIR